jgi:hypothetical protein
MSAASQRRQDCAGRQCGGGVSILSGLSVDMHVLGVHLSITTGEFAESPWIVAVWWMQLVNATGRPYGVKHVAEKIHGRVVPHSGLRAPVT